MWFSFYITSYYILQSERNLNCFKTIPAFLNATRFGMTAEWWNYVIKRDFLPHCFQSLLRRSLHHFRWGCQGVPEGAIFACFPSDDCRNFEEKPELLKALVYVRHGNDPTKFHFSASVGEIVISLHLNGNKRTDCSLWIPSILGVSALWNETSNATYLSHFLGLCLSFREIVWIPSQCLHEWITISRSCWWI